MSEKKWCPVCEGRKIHEGKPCSHCAGTGSIIQAADEDPGGSGPPPDGPGPGSTGQ